MLAALTHAQRVHLASLTALAGAAGVVLWLLVLSALAIASRPRLDPAGPPTMDVGPEPPAVASFLAHAWRVAPSAVPATLIDLAARHVLAIDEVKRGSYLIRLPHGPEPADLTAYERRVLDHVRKKAAKDGTLPAADLDLGSAKDTTGWMDGFEAEVRADARARGLSRPRWSRPAKLAIALVALVPAGLLAAAVGLVPPGTTPSGHRQDNPAAGAVALGLFLWGLMAFAWVVLRAERDTAEGRRAASAWLGVRAALAADAQFPSLPPAAVAIWNRMLAYGAAMDVARAAVRALPFGAEDPYRAWSSCGGSWRLVRIRRRHHVGWGRTRAGAFFGGFGQALLGTFWFAAPALAAWAVLNNGWSTSTHSPKANVGGAALISLMAIPGLILMVRGSLSMVNSLLSLGRPLVVEGWVLRFREVQHTGEHGGTWYERSLVVDDGRSAVLDRWPVPDGTDLSLLQEGNGVRVRVLRRIGRIRSVEATSPAPVATALPAPAYSGRL